MRPSDPAPQDELYGLITGYHLSHAVHVAAKLQLADLLKDGSKHPAELAAATATNPSSLRRVLRLLVNAHVLTEDDEGRFSLTPTGTYLRTDVPESMHAIALLWGGRPQMAWSRLLRCVQTGTPAFPGIFGADAFTYMSEHQEDAGIFDRGMAVFTQQTAAAVAAAYDFTHFKSVVDVGGGNGALLAGILASYPNLHGVLYDLPHVVERGKKLLERCDLLQRCSVAGGNFFEQVPAGHDAYVISNVITDWDDERAATILRNCRAAMTPESRLLIIEAVYPDRIDQSAASRAAVSTDVNVMVCTGGRERSEQEFRSLYESAGFTLTRIVRTRVRPCVIEGVSV
jgi:hypothetical protein